VPIAGPNGRVIACLSISAPKARKSLEDITLLVPTLQAAASRITRILSVMDDDANEDEAETGTARRKRS
jgi:IclR family transcriptional regulator, acetate operon repressor